MYHPATASAKVGNDLRLQAKPVDGAEHEVQLAGRPDAQSAHGLVASAIEQFEVLPIV